MKRFRVLLPTLTISVALIMSGLTAGSHAQSGPTSSQSIQARSRFLSRLESMRVVARQNQVVRVIIGISIEGLAKAGREERDTLITAAQDRVLSRLTLRDPGSVKRFRRIPYLAVELDEPGLEQLAPLVELNSIAEDRLDQPLLAESLNLIRARGAWHLGLTGEGQNIAILDTGIDNDHYFLAGKIVDEACFSTTSTIPATSSVCPGGASGMTGAETADNQSSELSGFDHGTHVAGIAAGRSPELSGVARDAGIIAINVFSRHNSVEHCRGGQSPCLVSFRSDQLRGLERVLELSESFKIAAVNLSLGSGRFTSVCDQENAAYHDLVNELKAVGIATVAAAGNDGFKEALAFPACLSSVISVGSSGDGSLIIERNPVTGERTVNVAPVDSVVTSSNSAPFLSLLAPGLWITSAVPGNQFAARQGTSMAAAHVSGAFAILRQKSEVATVDDLVTVLQQSGVNIADSQNGLIKPRLDIEAAVTNLCPAESFNPGQSVIELAWGGATRSIDVEVNGAQCVWQARSEVDWIAVSSPPRQGSGRFSFTVLTNLLTPRTGTIRVGGQTITVVQTGR
jgi:subtilisin